MKIKYDFSAFEMNKQDEALRVTIRSLWPIQSKKMHLLMVPPNEGSHICPDTSASKYCYKPQIVFLIIWVVL